MINEKIKIWVNVAESYISSHRGDWKQRAVLGSNHEASFFWSVYIQVYVFNFRTFDHRLTLARPLSVSLLSTVFLTCVHLFHNCMYLNTNGWLPLVRRKRPLIYWLSLEKHVIELRSDPHFFSRCSNRSNWQKLYTQRQEKLSLLCCICLKSRPLIC